MADCGVWVVGLLEVEQNDSVLEVGFGPGVVIQRLSNSNCGVAGIDQSLEMVGQARARNAIAIQSGRVDLRHGSVESLPFDDDSFDKVLAINAMQVWTDPVAGLWEMRRVMKRGGRIATWLYALFGAAGRRTARKTHKRWLHERARSGDRQGVLCAGNQAVAELEVASAFVLRGDAGWAFPISPMRFKPPATFPM